MTRQLFEVAPRSSISKDPVDSVLRNTTGVIGEISSRVPPSAMNLLVLSYRNFPDAWFHSWRRQVETLPQEIGFVRIGGATRSAAAGERMTERREPPSLVEALPDPADLTELKGLIRAYLREWADNGHRTVIYLDSLIPLLRFVGLSDAYSFLHTLTGRIRSVNGYGYYLVRSSTENREIVDLLFDLSDDHTNLANPTPSQESAHE